MLNKAQTLALVKHLRDMALILETSESAAAPVPVGPEPKKKVAKAERLTAAAVPEPVVEEGGKKRGRKPGAVADEERCENVNDKQQRCKNRATQGTVCGKHLTTE